MNSTASPGQGHPISVVLRAKELVEMGWPAERASRILAEEGVLVAGRTIRQWTDPALAERDRQRNKAFRSKRAFEESKFRLTGRTEGHVRGFILRLDAENLAATSIAKVCGVLYGGGWTRARVKAIIEQAGES